MEEGTLLWVKWRVSVPSSNQMAYRVEEALPSVPVIPNLKEAGAQSEVLFGLWIPIPGVLPLNTAYVLVAVQPLWLTTVYFNVKLPMVL